MVTITITGACSAISSNSIHLFILSSCCGCLAYCLCQNFLSGVWSTLTMISFMVCQLIGKNCPVIVQHYQIVCVNYMCNNSLVLETLVTLFKLGAASVTANRMQAPNSKAKGLFMLTVDWSKLLVAEYCLRSCLNWAAMHWVEWYPSN